MTIRLKTRGVRFWVTPDPQGHVAIAVTDPELEHRSLVLYLHPPAALALADELRRAAQKASEIDGERRWAKETNQ